METLVSLISKACLLSSLTVPHQAKLDCIEIMVNCSVGINGEITKKTIEACEKQLPKRGKK